MRLERDGEAWVCPDCGERHEGLLTFFSQPAPASWSAAPLWARLRAGRARSFRIIRIGHERRCFVRGHLMIPRLEHPEDPFGWSVWAQVSESDFDVLLDTIEDPRRVEQAPIRGVLDADLPFVAPTQGLSVLLHQNPLGQVNDIKLAECETHPLAAEQRQGISEVRVAQINHEVLYSRSG